MEDIDLYSIFSHEKFVFSKKFTELKHNIGHICEELSGIQAEEKSLESQTIAVIRRLKKEKKGLGTILKCEKDKIFLHTKLVRLEREKFVKLVQQVNLL